MALTETHSVKCVHTSMHTHSPIHAQTHMPHPMLILTVTMKSLALGNIHPPSFVIDLLFIDAIFINSIAKQHVSHANENLVAICLASSAHLCLEAQIQSNTVMLC